jgi:hypothetical protein
MNKAHYFKNKVSVFFSVALICTFFVVCSVTLVDANMPNNPKLSDNAEITLGYRILFDEAHVPVCGITNESVAFEYADGYSLFADMLINEGYNVDTTNETLEYSVLTNYDLLIIVAPTGDYTQEEISTIYNWTSEGNSLLLIGDWGSTFGNSSNAIGSAFGYTCELDALYDTDDNEGNTYWMILNETNIKNHQITVGIDAVEVYAADGIVFDPIGAQDIIATDADGTTQWLSGGVANNIPIVSTYADWNGLGGKLVFVSDSNLWTNKDTDGDTILNFNEKNNSLLALNIVKWLSPITVTAPLQGVYFSFIAVFVILVTFIRIRKKKR